jgi:lysozyme
LSLFGVDTSNNNFSSAAECANFMAALPGEGFAWVEAKVSEGDYYQDPYWPVTKTACAAAGIPAIGYHYAASSSPPASQAETFVANGGGSFVMIDFEANSGTITDLWNLINAFNAIGVVVALVYLPNWYWNEIGSPSLAGVPGLVSSNYVGGSGFASALYPGANGAGWVAYGGATPQIWQFTDAASVAGITVDANAFEGTPAQLDNLLGVAVTDPDAPILNQILGIVQDIQVQLRGPGLTGWPQLGQNPNGNNLTVVDALADVKDNITLQPTQGKTS